MLQALRPDHRSIFSFSPTKATWHKNSRPPSKQGIFGQSLTILEALRQLSSTRHIFLIYRNTFHQAFYRRQPQPRASQQKHQNRQAFVLFLILVVTALTAMVTNKKVILALFHTTEENTRRNQKGPRFTKENTMSILLSINSLETYWHYL